MINTKEKEKKNEKDLIKTSSNYHSQLGYGTSEQNDGARANDSTTPSQSLNTSQPCFTSQTKQPKLQLSLYYSNTCIVSLPNKRIYIYEDCSGNKVKLKRFSSLQYIKPGRGLISQTECMGISKPSQVLLDSSYHQLAIKQLRMVGQWDFDIFTLENNTSGHSLIYLILRLFEQYDWVRIFKINVIDLFVFIKMVEEGYHSANSYHNCIHAADVTQAMHCNIQEIVIRVHLSAEETMASIIAAACHDLDHPGVNQAFLISTKNPLSLLYQNTAVLENHHYHITKNLLHRSNLLRNVSRNQMKTIDTILHHTILATDICQHNKLLNKFENDIKSMSLKLHSSAEDRNFVMQMALKCADISNPCRKWPVCFRWSEMICTEFFRQGDSELKMGFPVSPTQDRTKSSVASVQIGFTSYIVQPLFDLWDSYVTSEVSQTMLRHMKNNKDKWTRVKDHNTKFSFQELYLTNQNNSSLFLCPRDADVTVNTADVTVNTADVTVDGCCNGSGVSADIGGAGCIGGGRGVGEEGDASMKVGVFENGKEESEVVEEADVWEVFASKRRHSVPVTNPLPNHVGSHKNLLNLVPECVQESTFKDNSKTMPPNQPAINSTAHAEDITKENNNHFLEIYKSTCRRSSFPLNVSLSPEHNTQATVITTAANNDNPNNDNNKNNRERNCSGLVTFLVSGFISSLYISVVTSDSRQRHNLLHNNSCFKGVLGFGVDDRMRRMLASFVLSPSKSLGNKEHSTYSNHLLLLTNQLVASNLLT